MNQRTRNKPIWTALAVAFTFLFTTVAAPVAEANFWEQRRDASRRANGKASSASPLYASLPASLGDIDRVLPAVNGALGNALRAQPPAELNGVETPEDRRAAQLPAWLRGLPSAAGEIRRVTLAKNPDAAPVAVLIQDVHDVFSAQTNIARILDHIQTAAAKAKAGTVLVGVEGAHGPFNVKEYRDQKNLPGYDLAAQLLLKTNLIAGPEYLALTAQEEPALWGVETPADYVENVEAYRAARPAQDITARALDAVEAAWNRKAADVLSPGLRSLNQTLTSYAEGKASLIQLMNALGDSPAAASLAEVKKLNRALELESKIDFQRVEKERAGLIEVLVRKLDPAAVERLIAASLNYRAGRIGFGAYNRELQALVKSHGISWSNYTAFDRYVQYVLTAEDIDKFRLFDEIDTLKKDAVAAAVKTPAEKALMDLAEDLRLAHRLIRQEFGPAEWRLYVEHRKTAPALNDRVKAVLGTSAPDAPSAQDMARFERFYTAAERRNDSLTANLKARAQRMGAGVLTLVAGGFHTSELEHRLAKDGFSVVTITPQMGDVPSGTKYLDIFMVKNIPIEEYLAGDALYLSPPHATTTVPMPGLTDNPKTPGAVRRGMAAALVALTAMLAGLPAAKEVQEKHFSNLDLTLDVNPVSGLPRVHAEGGPTVYGRIGALPYDGNPRGVEIVSEGETQESRVGLMYTADNVGRERSGVVAALATFLFLTAPAMVKTLGQRTAGFGRGVRTATAESGPLFAKVFVALLGVFGASSAQAGTGAIVAFSTAAFIGVVAIAALAVAGVWLVGRALSRPKVSVETIEGFDLNTVIAFGTSGWRGVTRPGQFSAQNVRRLAQAIATKAKEDGLRRIVVGYDARPGAPAFARDIAAVLAANGLEAVLADQVNPTPVMAELTRPEIRNRFDLAVMLTASHNDKLIVDKDTLESHTWLGVKVLKDGIPADDGFTKGIAALANDPARNAQYQWIADYTPTTLDANQAGLERLRRAFGLVSAPWLAPLQGKIIVDPMFGGTINSVELFKELGLAAETVNQMPMGFSPAPDFALTGTGQMVPWGPDPSQAHFVRGTVEKLKPGQWGFFIDGDGDRLVIAEKATDAEAEFISPNDLSLIFAHYLLEKGLHGTEGKPTLVRTAPTTRWLDRLARAKGLDVVDTPVGSKHFGTEMDNLVVAAEESGHVFFRLNGEVFADSAMAEALLSVRVLAEHGTLGAYLQKIKDEIKAYEAKNGIEPVDLAYSRTKFTAKSDADAASILTMKDTANEGAFRAALGAAMSAEPLLSGKAIRAIVRTSATGTALDKDGLLVEFTDGTWMMWRKSGTEPAFRIYAEQNSAEVADAMDRAMSAVMTRAAQGPLAAASPTSGIPEGVLQRGAAYRDGRLTTDPVRQPFRPSVEADVPLIAAMSPEERARYMKAGVNVLVDGKVNFSVLAAGAASRMNAKEAPPEALAMIEKMYGGKKSDIHSKAAVPVAEVDGRVYTFLGTFLSDVARLERELESVTGGVLPANTVSVLTNDEYRSELDGELDLMGRYGVRGEILTPHQSLGDQYIGTVADTQKLKEKLGDKYEAALAAAKAAEAKLAAGDRTAVVLPNEKTPLGHGEFFHQMVASGDLLRHIDRGVRAIYVRNIDNAPATLDSDWLVMLGMFVENDLDFQAEVSPRAPGMKGGALIKTAQGQLVLTEGPSFQASWDKLVADKKTDGWVLLGKEEGAARAAAAFDRDGRLTLDATPMDVEGGALADREAALSRLNDGSVVAFDRNGEAVFARRIVPESTYWFNNAAGFFRPQYLYFMYRRDAQQTYDQFVEEMRNADENGRAAIADRGRARFPTLIDPKPAKGQPAVAVKIETNMWQGTQVAADAGAKLAAAGVFSIQNILSIGADSRAMALPHLRFLATKQWTGPAESYESNKPYIGTILSRALTGKTIPSDLLTPKGLFPRTDRGFATVGPLVVLAVLAAGLLFAPAAFAAGTETVTAVRDLAPWLWAGMGVAALGFFAFTARGRRAADTLLRAFDDAPVWVKGLIIAAAFIAAARNSDAALASVGVLGTLALGRRAGPTVYDTVGSKPNWDAMVPPVADPLAALRAKGEDLAARVVGADRLNALGQSFSSSANNRGEFDPLFRDPEAQNADRGGWVGRPWELNADPAYLDAVEAEAAGMREKFDRLVIVGMGGESSIVGPDQTLNGKTMTVVANTAPEKLQRAAYSLTPAELQRTVFYVISKSGGTSETLANLDLITGLLRSQGIDPKTHIVYVTDPGTGLAQRGEKEGIPVKSREYKDNTNTGGRNTLVNFPTLLALAFLTPGAARAQVKAIVDNHAQTPTAADPWIQAANRLSAAMQTGVTKMAALEPESLRAQLGVWQQQNVEESLGKDGKGLTVYTQAPPLDVLALNANRDWVFVELQMADRENETAPIAQAYRDAGYEVITVPVPAGAAATAAASYGWMKMVAFLGALSDINFSNQPAVESYKTIMKTGSLSLDSTEDKARAARALASADGVTVSFDGLLPFLSEAQRQRVGRLLNEKKLSPAEILGRVLADARAEKPTLRDLTLSYYEDADPQTADFLADLSVRYQAATGDAVKWGEGTGVLHGLFVNWFGGPLHQIPVHIVSRKKGDFYAKGSTLLQEGAVAAHEALVKAGRPSVLVVLDADLDAAGRRTVGRFFGDLADAVVVADGALAAGARDTMDALGETPVGDNIAARYADGVVSGLLSSQLAVRANLRHERLADTVLTVAGSFAAALFSADVAAQAQTHNRQIVDAVKADAKAQAVAIGGVETGRAVTRYLDGTSSREALQDALNTMKRHLAGENSVALSRPGTGLLVVLESELREGENADLVRAMEALGAQHPRVKVQVGEGNDVLTRNEKGERVLRVGPAIQLLGVQPTSIDVIVPPATATLVEKAGFEDIVRVLRWILGGVAVEVTSGVEAGIQALVATLKSA